MVPRQPPSPAQLLRQAIDEVEAERAQRRVRDLRIRVGADATGADLYRISVTNSGARVFEALHVAYEPVLLHAEKFGVDTTHMPPDLGWVAAEPLLLASIAPGQTVEVRRRGYGDHRRYDGPRAHPVRLAFSSGGTRVAFADGWWAQVDVDLPNAGTA